MCAFCLVSCPLPTLRACCLLPHTTPCPCGSYQRFLEGVLEVADEYQEVPDLLLRHATLKVQFGVWRAGRGGEMLIRADESKTGRAMPV